MAEDSGLVADAAEPDIPVLTPHHVTTIALQPQDAYFALTPDGSRAYVPVQMKAIDAWPLLIHRLPEIGGALSGVTALLLLWTWLRYRRRRHRTDPTQPYCRRCSYQLTGITAVTCPECGADLGRHRPIMGRRVGRLPLTLAAVAALIVGVAYSAMWATDVHRNAEALQWTQWRFVDLHKATRGRWSSWVDDFERDVVVLHELDARTGDVRRRLALGETLYLPQVSPDGRLLTIDVNRTIETWHVASGRRASVYRREPTQSERGLIIRSESRTGFTTVDRSVWVAWDLLTGRELNRWSRAPFGDLYYQYPASFVDRFVSVILNHTTPYRVDMETGVWTPLAVPSENYNVTTYNHIWNTAPSSDGRWLFTRRDYNNHGDENWPRRVERWDLQHARHDGLAVREDQSLAEFYFFRLTPCDRLLMLHNYTLGKVSVHRVSDGQRVAELELGHTDSTCSIRFCHDGRTAVIYADPSHASPRLLWFDLGTVFDAL